MAAQAIANGGDGGNDNTCGGADRDSGPIATPTPLPTLTPTLTSTPRPLRPLDPGEDAVPVNYPTPEPWEGEERVTILLLGVDYGDWDSPGRAGPPRADTLLVLSVDPVARTAGMLSIPAT
jgi:hypothetical protein